MPEFLLLDLESAETHFPWHALLRGSSLRQARPNQRPHIDPQRHWLILRIARILLPYHCGKSGEKSADKNAEAIFP
jgi:hypothetical protein